MHSGKNEGAAVHVEAEFDAKIPAAGCHHHYVERLEDAAQREAFGPTSAPEEGYAKRIKMWWNEDETKTCKNVKKMLLRWSVRQEQGKLT